MTSETLQQQYKELLVTNATLKLQINRRQQNIERLKYDVVQYQKEIEKQKLEKKWLFGEQGERLKPLPSEEATHICNKLAEQPIDATEDVLQALRQKKSHLDSQIFDLQRELKLLKDEG